MKALNLCVLILISVLLSGCLYGQCIDGPCALERARMIRSIKAYGEYFVKPDMTKESWRADWVACGGWDNGQYGAGPRLPGETGDIAASSRKARELTICMQSKGYEYRREP